MFDVFDSDSEAGRVYQTLVVVPWASVTEIANRTGFQEAAVRRFLAILLDEDVAWCRDPEDEIWEARRPDLVAARMLRQFDEWRDHVHETEARLTETFRFARSRNGDVMNVELLRDQEVFTRYRKIQGSARSEVLSMDRPPYYWDEAEIVRQERLQAEQMQEGVVYRTIYQESESDAPLRNASMARNVANGEWARVLSNPPVKFTIVDNEVAVLAFDPPPGAAGSLMAMLLYRSPVLDALVNIFESLWRLAVPVNLIGEDHELSSRERDILTLMASGAGDDAIARRLGVSRRTIVRDIGGLMELMGTTTRFQAGAQAARRGWL